jgi:hypothetical protein
MAHEVGHVTARHLGAAPQPGDPRASGPASAGATWAAQGAPMIARGRVPLSPTARTARPESRTSCARHGLGGADRRGVGRGAPARRRHRPAGTHPRAQGAPATRTRVSRRSGSWCRALPTIANGAVAESVRTSAPAARY